MSDSQSSKFRTLLEAKRDDLLSTYASREEIAIEASADEVERLQQQLSRDLVIHRLDNTSKLLNRIEAALRRIEEDVYGVCLRRDNPIGEKRLNAIPWAQYCVKCQELIDRECTLDDGRADGLGFAA